MNTPTYLAETVAPAVGEGRRRAGRDDARLALFVPLFTVVGDTDEERTAWRERARKAIGFYGSTPNYSFVFDQIGFEGVTDHLRQAHRPGGGQLHDIVTDELLAHFVVEGTWDELPERIVARCAGLDGFDVHPVLYQAAGAARGGGDTFERFGEVARAVAAVH